MIGMKTYLGLSDNGEMYVFETTDGLLMVLSWNKWNNPFL